MKKLLLLIILSSLYHYSFSQVNAGGTDLVYKNPIYNELGEFIGYNRNTYHEAYNTSDSVEDELNITVYSGRLRIRIYRINDQGYREYIFDDYLESGTSLSGQNFSVDYEFTLGFLKKNSEYHVEIFSAPYGLSGNAFFVYNIFSANKPCYPPIIEMLTYCDPATPTIYYAYPIIHYSGFYGVEGDMDIVDQFGNKLSDGLTPAFTYTSNVVVNYTVETPGTSCADIALNGITNNCNVLLQDNDECIDAIDLTLENEFCLLGTPSHVGTLAATVNPVNQNCEPGGNDVWYRVQNNTGATDDIVIHRITEPGNKYEVYKGTSCNTMTSLGCTNRNNFSVDNVAAGDYVYVRVWIDGNSEQFADVNFCAFLESNLANDDCAGATPLTVNSTMNGNTPLKITAETFGATPSASSNCGGNDVWFSFVATQSVHIIELSNTLSSGSPFDGSTSHELLSGDCASLSSIYCSDELKSYADNLIENETYYIQVKGTDIASDRKFDITVLTPEIPENDDCSTAEFISQNNNDFYYSGSTLAASQSSTGCSPGSTADDDVWYKFIATTTTQELSLASLVSELGPPDFLIYELFTDDCGNFSSFSSLSCGVLDISTDVEFTNLSPGETYYFRLYSFRDDTYFSYVLDFEGLAPPAVDTCAGTVHLAVNPNMECNITHLVTGKAAVLENGLGCFGENVQDTWYTFTAAGTSMNFYATLEFVPVSFEIYHNDCDNLVSLGCGQERLTTDGLIENTDYLLRVITPIGNEENYEICIRTIPPAPLNDDCLGATALTINSGNCNNVTAGSFLSSNSSDNDCYNSPINKDVWYSFVATNSIHWLEVSDLTNAFTGMESFASVSYEVYSGTCGSLSSLLCVDNIDFNNQEITGLTTNNTYWVRIFQDGFSEASNFNICIKDTTPPSNDEPAGAIELIQSAEDLFCTNYETFTFQYATESNPANSCEAITGNADDDVWFSFKAATSNPTIEVIFLFGQAIIELYESDASTFISCNTVGQLNASGLTIGNTYYFRVYDFDAVAASNGFNFEVCLRGLPSGTISSSTNVDPTMCVVSDGTVTSTGSNRWLHITHGGQLVASVFDSESLGLINNEFYINNTGTIRTVSNNEYLDRNFEITPTIQPSNDILVRFYITNTEFQSLSAASPDVNLPDDLSIIRYSGTDCDNVQANTIGNIHTVINWGQLASNDYYLDVEIDHFSSFFFQGGTVLPIELYEFTASLNQKDIELSWTTLSEINNRGFQIERSKNGTDFENIGWVDGEINSTIKQHYSFIDETVEVNGTYYYRLLQIDLDNNSEYSNIISIDLKHFKNQPMEVFPNPASGVINLNIKEITNNELSLHLYNIMGQEVIVRSLEKNTTLEINTNTLKSGTYFAILKGDNQIIDSQKIMILK